MNARVLTTIICANSRSTAQSIHHKMGYTMAMWPICTDINQISMINSNRKYSISRSRAFNWNVNWTFRLFVFIGKLKLMENFRTEFQIRSKPKLKENRNSLFLIKFLLECQEKNQTIFQRTETSVRFGLTLDFNWIRIKIQSEYLTHNC